MTKPTLLVRINYSENSEINSSPLKDGAFHPIEEVNKLFWPIDFKNKNSDRGYDKTGFTLLVWDGIADDDLSEYNGRIDLGDGYNSPNILQEHVKQHCQFTMENKDRLPFAGPRKEREEHLKALKFWEAAVSE